MWRPRQERGSPPFALRSLHDIPTIASFSLASALLPIRKAMATTRGTVYAPF